MLNACRGLIATVALVPLTVFADDHAGHDHSNDTVADAVIAQQRLELQRNTSGKGFGPQSPRDIDSVIGANPRIFSTAPAHTKMNLCNIHFHHPAEHKGGEFAAYVGNGDGQGNNTGYRYSGRLSPEQLAPVSQPVCPSEAGVLEPGDTIELHYVHTTAQVEPGPTLGACLSESTANPQLRVETQVFVVVNDHQARDFGELTALGVVNGYQQALNIPNDTGTPIQYAGSTTGPSYNQQGSPLQVTWSVRPQVASVNIETVSKWCENNVFEETGAHAVRNLVINPELLSPIEF